jgi:hypothetical protein
VKKKIVLETAFFVLRRAWVGAAIAAPRGIVLYPMFVKRVFLPFFHPARIIHAERIFTSVAQ